MEVETVETCVNMEQARWIALHFDKFKVKVSLSRRAFPLLEEAGCTADVMLVSSPLSKLCAVRRCTDLKRPEALPTFLSV